ncbi:hypothetical protein IJD44_07535 [bacterium]|nr:hypothetical protein [bacterium]
MGLTTLGDVENKEFSPKEIREMLGVDNSGIQELCKIADIKLKKNARGLTYFTKDDAKILKSVKTKDEKSMTLPVKTTAYQGTNTITSASVVKLVETLKDIETNMTKNITSILDEKLDGMDDVVLELIRVKTENETMRFKINELNKEIYKLKKEVNSFKKVPFGFYAKTSAESDWI